MAKSATAKAGRGKASGAKTGGAKTGGAKSGGGGKAGAKSKVPARLSSGGGSRSSASKSEAFIRLLQSPLVAELVAVAATAAIAALTEQGFTSGGGTRGKRAGQAIKYAGKAAAAAVGRRLGTEIEEIRRSAMGPRSGATGGAKA